MQWIKLTQLTVQIYISTLSHYQELNAFNTSSLHILHKNTLNTHLHSNPSSQTSLSTSSSSSSSLSSTTHHHSQLIDKENNELNGQPVSPGCPVGPVNPGCPAGPCCPRGPGSPVAPAGPDGPTGPGEPTNPEGPG